MRTEPASLRDTKFEAINMIAANSALLRVIVVTSNHLSVFFISAKAPLLVAAGADMEYAWASSCM